MKRLLFVLALVASVPFLLAQSWAGVGPPTPPVYVHVGGDETVASIGLRFDFGDMNAEVVGAVRHTNTNSSNDVAGALGEIAFPIMGEKRFVPTVRAMGILGVPDVQGLAGVGYDFAEGQALIGAGVQGPFVEGGLDWYFNGDLHPYVGINSYDGAEERELIQVLPPPPPPPPPIP